MASRAGLKEFNFTVTNSDEVEMWLEAFEAKCRIEKINEENEDGTEKPRTDMFMSMCGTDTLVKLKYLVNPQKISKKNLTYSQIKWVMFDYLKPKEKLIIAERTKFLDIKQTENENISAYYSKIKKHLRIVNLMNCKVKRIYVIVLPAVNNFGGCALCDTLK